MRILAEWDNLTDVLVHRPGIEIEYGMLAPKSFLYERAFNVEKAIEEHVLLENLLKENGVNLRLLEDVVVSKARESREFRADLENYVKDIVHFYGKMDDVREASETLSKNLEIIDERTLFHYMTLEPSIDLKKDYENMENYPTVYSNIPLANLYFMRDQQAVGSGGVIIGNMKRDQRSREPQITNFVFSKIFNEKRIYRTSNNGHFEGGDFMPAGSFCLIGTGSRTDINGAFEAMNSGMIDYDRIGIVTNPSYDFSASDRMVNMHLDTYFNIAGDGLCVTSVYLAKKATISIYGKNEKNQYVKESESNLYDFMKSQDFEIIDLSIPEQQSYASNFLTLKDRKIISVNVNEVIKRLLKNHAFNGEVEGIISKEYSKLAGNVFPVRKDVRDHGIDLINAELIELTGGYGGAHCMTAALNRS